MVRCFVNTGLVEGMKNGGMWSLCADGLFEVITQIGRELGMHQRLHENRFAWFWRL